MQDRFPAIPNFGNQFLMLFFINIGTVCHPIIKICINTCEFFPTRLFKHIPSVLGKRAYLFPCVDLRKLLDNKFLVGRGIWTHPIRIKFTRYARISFRFQQHLRNKQQIFANDQIRRKAYIPNQFRLYHDSPALKTGFLFPHGTIFQFDCVGLRLLFRNIEILIQPLNLFIKTASHG